jgi:hypothetical protein
MKDQMNEFDDGPPVDSTQMVNENRNQLDSQHRDTYTTQLPFNTLQRRGQQLFLCRLTARGEGLLKAH